MAVLFQSDHGGNFRKKDGNDTLVLPQNALCVLAAQQLAKFNLNPFFGDLMQQVFLLEHCIGRLLFDGESQGRSKTKPAENPQGVLLKTLFRDSDTAQSAAVQVV